MMTGPELLMASAVDLLIGDPRWLPHPVRMMGGAIAWCDDHVRTICTGPISLRAAGVCLALGLPAMVYAVGETVISVAAAWSDWAGALVSVAIASTTLAGRDLWDHVRAVHGPLAEGHLPEARQAVAMIVGRDTDQLSESGVARAAVETIAESLADGVIAPLCYLAIGGAPLALAYKAINTLDSMVGHLDARHREFGWASARLDDVANWIPARLAAVLLICAAGVLTGRFDRMRQGWGVLWRDGGQHPSPNSGRPEAAMAGVLGVRLGGRNYYDGVAQERPVIGAEGRSPVPSDIEQASRIMVAACGLGLCLAVGWRWLQ